MASIKGLEDGKEISNWTRKIVMYFKGLEMNITMVYKTSGKHGDSDKAIYSFKIFKISIITIRITYHQIKLDKAR